MVLYYINKLNETSQLKVIPALFESGLRFGDYDGIVELNLSAYEVAKLNNMFFYRNNEYGVNAENFIYPFDSRTIVGNPPPKNHTPCKDVGTGLIEQMAYDITGSIHDVASFENTSELRYSIDESIKSMFAGQKYKLGNQGTKKNPIDEKNSIVKTLLDQSKTQCCLGGNSCSGWKTFQFHQGDCLAFNLTFKSPGKMNKDKWATLVKDRENKKGTDVTYSIRLKFNHCCQNPDDANADMYCDYGLDHCQPKECAEDGGCAGEDGKCHTDCVAAGCHPDNCDKDTCKEADKEEGAAEDDAAEDDAAEDDAAEDDAAEDDDKE